MNNLIPKKIHYVWVGGKEKPDLVKRCIESWKKHCPDYEIIEWNDVVLEKIDNIYVKQAYENKKWAFVSDYLRLWVLYNYGGFYFDTDLEVTNNIDRFLEYKLVMGYEIWNGEISPLTAFLGAEKRNNVVRDLLDLYTDLPFIKNGEMDETTNVLRLSRWLGEKYDFNKPYDGTQFTKIKDDLVIFPYWFFCTPENNKENYSIHHFNGSWIDPYIRKTILKFGKYKIVRYKKRLGIEGTYLPLISGEKKVCEIIVTDKRKYCLIQSN